MYYYLISTIFFLK